MHIYPTRHTVIVSIPTAVWQKKNRERIDAHVVLLAFRPLYSTTRCTPVTAIHSYATCSLRYFS